MLEFINNIVDYKIFDLTDKRYLPQYPKNNSADAAKLMQIVNYDIKEKIKSDYSLNELVILKQEHRDNIYSFDHANYIKHLDDNQYPVADASMTNQINVGLAIKTADCVPILLADGNGHLISAVHSGWKGARLNIVKKTIELMRKNGAKNIQAIIGPAIAQNSYEVNQQYYHDFIKHDKLSDEFFIDSENNNHYMFDLPGYVKSQILSENIEIFKDINENTYALTDKYPSYRRSFHKKEKLKYSILSMVVIRNKSD